MGSFKMYTQLKKTKVRSNHDGTDNPLPGRKPSEAFMTALKAVRATPEKTKK